MVNKNSFELCNHPLRKEYSDFPDSQLISSSYSSPSLTDTTDEYIENLWEIVRTQQLAPLTPSIRLQSAYECPVGAEMQWIVSKKHELVSNKYRENATNPILAERRQKLRDTCVIKEKLHPILD